MVALPQAFDPTPASLEGVIGRMPAAVRARIEWFPAAFRSTVVEPLRAAPPASFRAVVDDVTLDAVRVFLRLFANLGELAALFDAELAEAVTVDDLGLERHQRIAGALEPLDVDASDDLREAYERLRALFAATSIGLGAEATKIGDATEVVAAVTDDQIRAELAGERGAFWRGMLLTGAAVDLVLEGAPLPPTIVAWCRLACKEVRSAARALREAGIAVPSEVDVPGFTRSEWSARRGRGARRATHTPLLKLQSRAGACPPGIVERIVELIRPDEIWLFGSRARGTANPDSDWDLLVVLPDGAPDPRGDDALWDALRDVRRSRVDISFVHRSDFDLERGVLGTLSQIVANDGRQVHAR